MRWVFLALALPLTANADTARGTVFEDTNTNGVRDAGEPGVANVRVSNGVDVVLTDGEGVYQLEVGDEAIIFITKPAGYATPVDADQLPQFYYVHQPADRLRACVIWASPPPGRYQSTSTLRLPK